MHELLRIRKNFRILLAFCLSIIGYLTANITKLFGRRSYGDVSLGPFPKIDTAKLFDSFAAAIAVLWDTPNKVIVKRPENLVNEGPAIIISNHLKMNDPFLDGWLYWKYTPSRRRIGFMMRDDYFGTRWYFQNSLVNLNELAYLVGARMISRYRFAIDQLDRLIAESLGKGLAYITYPSGTRTRKGKLFEVPPGKRFGRVGQSVVRAQNLLKEKEGREILVPISPMVRTLNMVSKVSTFVIGEPISFNIFFEKERHLIEKENLSIEDICRKFDEEVIIPTMERMVAINIGHLFASYVIARAEQAGARSGRLAFARSELVEDLSRTVKTLIEDAERTNDLHLDEGMVRTTDQEIDRAEAFFAKHGIVDRRASRRGETVLNLERLFYEPEKVNLHYKDRAPALYLRNGVAHFGEVRAALEAVIRDRSPNKRSETGDAQ